MTRPTLRRTPMLERLETRQVLSVVAGLSADKQYVLELINQVRTNPKAAADRVTAHIGPNVQATLDSYGLSADGLKAKLGSAAALPPVAYNAALDASAQAQSQFQADNAVQTHQGAGGRGIAQRFADAGYANPLTQAENTYAYAQSADQAMQSFLFDWGVADGGHYKNLVQPGKSAQDAFDEVGIGLVHTTKGVGPLVLTQDFGSRQGAGPQVLGVAFDDADGDVFYTPGEGQAGLTIDALNLATGVNYRTETGASGGYQIPVASNADYRISALRDGRVVRSETIRVDDVNEKVDFILDVSAPIQAAPPVVAVDTAAADAARAAEARQMAESRKAAEAAQAMRSEEEAKAAAEAQRVADEARAAEAQRVVAEATKAPAAASDSPAAPAVVNAAPALSDSKPAWLSKWSRWKAINGASEA